MNRDSDTRNPQSDNNSGPASTASSESAAVQNFIDEQLAAHPHLKDRILRQILVSLHEKGIVTIDQIYDGVPRTSPAPPDDPGQRPSVDDVIRQHAIDNLKKDQIADYVNLVLKREEAQNLEDIAKLNSVSFRLLADEIRRFCALPLGETVLQEAEVMGIRVELIRKLISDHLEFIGVAKNHIRIREFDDIVSRAIGTDSGMGRIGGKAGGMLLGYRIYAGAQEKLGIDNEPKVSFPLAIPESFYLRSDVIEDFLELNHLSEYHNQKYKDIDTIGRELPLIKRVFRHGDFPIEAVQQLRGILERLDGCPLIIRSSSLLEDRLGTGFCGKYDSFFVANQGPLEMRLQSVLAAIAEVYASTLAPDPIMYRREHNLIDYDEDMAILIQRVIGTKIGPYFLPAFAGVAFSRNEYRWSPRIRKEDGFMRLVAGLGTGAVDRVGTGHPRMVALGAPTMRPEDSPLEITQRSQTTIDVINLDANAPQAITLEQLLATGETPPLFHQMVSIFREGGLYTPPGTFVDANPKDLVITFDKLLKDTDFAPAMLNMLKIIEAGYGVPVDVEFACDGEKLYLLQCRSQNRIIDDDQVAIPEDIAADRVVFTANRFIRGGRVDDIEFIIYVDPIAYDEIDSTEKRTAVGRLVGKLNRKLSDRRFIMVGPGRWGSKDLRLGVPVSYADINYARMLIEVARDKGGYVPEVSFGTHFFQDLVEAHIHYLPLYPDQPGIEFNHQVFNKSPNSLAEILPDDNDLADIVRLIHLPAAAGKTMNVAMDSDKEQALAYLN